MFQRLLLLIMLALITTNSFALDRSSKAIYQFKKNNKCPSNNKYLSKKCKGYEIDHIIPLKCNGVDAPTNMQWLSVKEHKIKTKKQTKLCK